MREKIYRVLLGDDDRAILYRLLSGGTAPARQLTHARILLKADEGADGPAWKDAAIADALEVATSTVGRVRRLFVREGRDAAHLIALACGAPPTGRERWIVRLLAAEFVTIESGSRVSRELVRRTLKQTRSNRG